MADSLAIYHDMHNRYGELLTWKSLHSDHMFSSLWMQYLLNQRSLEYRYQELLMKYIHKFQQFFQGFYPISFHAHASDAMMPTTITSLLLFLEEHSGSHNRLNWGAIHRQSPRLAILAGSFGTGYGPLASVCPFAESSSVACGPPPFVIVAADDADNIRATLERAKSEGCVALVIQIIGSTYPWRVSTPKMLQILTTICKSLQLPLIVDETITALRCGAPFAHQRQCYSESATPDFVIFGKALKVSGIAINFDGNIVKSFSIQSPNARSRCVFRWNDVHTRAIGIPSLVEALFVLELAKVEDWPRKSTKVGRNVREAIWKLEIPPQDKLCLADPHQPILGLDAIIYVEKHRIGHLVIQGIPEGDYTRLLPVLDKEMTSMDFLSNYVMGSGSASARKLTSKLLKKNQIRPIWCFVCGDATEEVLGDQVRWCEVCCIATCGYPECEQGFMGHHCLSQTQTCKL